MFTLPHRSFAWNPAPSLIARAGRFHWLPAEVAALVMREAICSIAEGADCWERVAGAFSTRKVEKAGGRRSFARRQVRMRAVMFRKKALPGAVSEGLGNFR